MLKKIIKYLTPKKTNPMTKHNDKKKEVAPEVTNEVTNEVAPKVTNEVAPKVTNEFFEGEEINEAIEDPEKFSIDMMNAFLNSNENLKIIKKQFVLDENHFVNITIAENERLLKIIEKLKPLK